ncbi:MAG: SIS domain-containing protein [Actinocatenispora sp.]
MTVDGAAYVTELRAAMDRVVDTQSEGVSRAATLIVASLRTGGVVQAFGSGHSEALAMEIAGRAGGLVPTNKLALRDVVVFGGESPEVLVSGGGGTLERDPTIARRVLDLAAVDPNDVFVIASNSGINGSVVEMARLVKERGHPLVAITSLQHTRRVEPRHPSGQRLADLADVVLDNAAPYGDATLPLPGGGAVGAVSSVTAALLAQLIVAEVVRQLLAEGDQPPVYLSANVPGGDEHNRTLEARYAGRIRRTA